MTVRAAIYCRISRDSEQRGLGVARQLKEATAKADQKGWHVGGEYIDNDISGTRKGGKTKYRPQFQALVKAIKAGDIDAVVAAEQSRLFRDPMELEQFLVVCERVGMHRLVTYNGELDIETGEGILYARIRAAVDAEETRKMGERIRRKHVEIAEGGGIAGGGMRPFGYESDRITVRRDEAREIQRAARRIIAGASLRSIVVDWNERGVKSVTGVAWSSTTVRRLLLSARISGRRSHKGEIVADAVWPKIITVQTAERVAMALSEPRAISGTIWPRTYILSGLIYCGRCKGKVRMTASPLMVRHKYRYRRYHCKKDRGGCNSCGINADHAEAFVEHAVFAALAGRAVVEPASSGDDELIELHDGLAADEAALAQLSRDYYVERIVNRSEFLAAKGPIDARIALAHDRIARIRRQSAPVGRDGGRSIEDRWPSMSFDQRRTVIEAFIDKVVIAPVKGKATAFDPGRISILWRI